MPASYRFVVTGQVQGVFFRQSAVDQARRLSLAGWVRNRDDGCVEGIASGDADALGKFQAWLQRGPPAARVERVDWMESADEPGSGFVIRR
jgi:acylphosphatase